MEKIAGIIARRNGLLHRVVIRRELGRHGRNAQPLLQGFAEFSFGSLGARDAAMEEAKPHEHRLFGKGISLGSSGRAIPVITFFATHNGIHQLAELTRLAALREAHKSK